VSPAINVEEPEEEEAGEACALAGRGGRVRWQGAVTGRQAGAHGNAVFLRPLLAKGEGASVG
jgi:hypothetical protein